MERRVDDAHGMAFHSPRLENCVGSTSGGGKYEEGEMGGDPESREKPTKFRLNSKPSQRSYHSREYSQ